MGKCLCKLVIGLAEFVQISSCLPKAEKFLSKRCDVLSEKQNTVICCVFAYLFA